MPKLKSIDFESKTFKSNGTTYYLDTDGMCYDRIVKFVSAIPSLAHGVNYTELQKHFKEHLKILSSGSDLAKNYVEAYNHALNFHKVLSKANDDEFFRENVDQHLEFCALFVNTEDEDVTVYHKPTMDKKVNDWKKDMNMDDFFLLVKMQLPGFKDLLLELSKEKVDPKAIVK